MTDPKDLQMKSIFDAVPDKEDDVDAVSIIPDKTQPRTYAFLRKRLEDRAREATDDLLKPFDYHATKPPGSEDFAKHFVGLGPFPPADDRDDEVVEALDPRTIGCWVDEAKRCGMTVDDDPGDVFSATVDDGFEPDPYLQGRIAEACPGDWESHADQKMWTLDVGPFFDVVLNEVDGNVEYSVDTADGMSSVFYGETFYDDLDDDACPFAEAARRLRPYVEAIREFNEKVNQL